MGKVLLFYKYVDIEYPEREVKHQNKICSDLGLTGRVFIAHEGINATVAGEDHTIDHYRTYMKKHPLFHDIDFKESDGDSLLFPRLSVVVKKEIVHLGLEDVDLSTTGTRLTPEQAHKLMQDNPDDLLILDGRNDYESRIGHFKNAIIPPVKTFREFPTYIQNHKDTFKDKQVLMFCTGGIRCEKASAYLKKTGVAKEVYHIEGGIHRYVEQYPDGFFRGKNYVFDRRIAQKVTNDILTECDWCTTPCDEYTNCLNAHCNKQFIACTACLDTHYFTCNATCQKRVLEGTVVIRKKPAKLGEVLPDLSALKKERNNEDNPEKKHRQSKADASAHSN